MKNVEMPEYLKLNPANSEDLSNLTLINEPEPVSFQQQIINTGISSLVGAEAGLFVYGFGDIAIRAILDKPIKLENQLATAVVALGLSLPLTFLVLQESAKINNQKSVE